RPMRPPGKLAATRLTAPIAPRVTMLRLSMKSAGLILSVLAPLVLGRPAVAQPATPEVIEKDGVTRIRLLPPTSGTNPRNSEGAFVELKDGRLLFVYTHFTGGSGDHAAAHLAARSSVDGGRTWTAKDELVLPNEAQMNVMSVSLVRLASGEIALFYLRKN